MIRPAFAAALGVALAAPAAHAAETRVTYLAGGSVYVEAGRAQGLAEGDSLEVLRQGIRIAGLRVSFLSTRRASCDTFQVVETPKVGDRVRFEARAAAGAPDTREDSSAVTAAAPAPRVGSRLHGRAGLRWLSVQSGDAGSYQQPAGDLRVEGAGLGGGRFDLAVDLRARRGTRTAGSGERETSDETRLYRLSVATHDPGGRFRVSAGRLIAPLPSSVAMFDGALAEVRSPRWTAGAFSGFEPDRYALEPSTQVLSNGTFVEVRSQPLAARRWSVLMGGAVSSVRGELNRSFAFAQSFYRAGRFSASVSQEVDFNGGWKRTLGEPAVQPTNTFVNARADVTPVVAVQAGYDDRRMVRLWRDRTTPEDSFDDRHRRGAWTGATVDLRRALRLSGEVRGATAPGGGTSATWTAGADLRRVLPVRGVLRARWSHYSVEGMRNGLLAGSAGLDPFGALHLEVDGGLRSSEDPVLGLRSEARWTGVSFDAALGRRLQWSGSYERSRGDGEDIQQGDAALHWRF